MDPVGTSFQSATADRTEPSRQTATRVGRAHSFQNRRMFPFMPDSSPGSL